MPYHVRDRTGERYGHLVVLERAPNGTIGRNQTRTTRWVCKCDCGAETVKTVTGLNNGISVCSKTCPLGVHVRHRHARKSGRSKEFLAWGGMKRRCLSPKAQNYKRYGGRGVTIYPDWVDDFPAFLAYIGPAPAGYRMSIDRIDNAKGYEPGNVQWATPKQQQNNRDVTIRAQVRGKDWLLTELEAATGVAYHTLLARYHKGYTGEELIAPAHKRGRKPKA